MYEQVRYDFIQALEKNDIRFTDNGNQIIVMPYGEQGVWLYNDYIPENIVFQNGGNVRLNDLIVIPDNIIFNNDGVVLLASVKELNPTTQFNNSDDVHLWSMNELPSGFVFNCGGDVHYSNDKKILQVQRSYSERISKNYLDEGGEVKTPTGKIYGGELYRSIDFNVRRTLPDAKYYYCDSKEVKEWKYHSRSNIFPKEITYYDNVKECVDAAYKHIDNYIDSESEKYLAEGGVIFPYTFNYRNYTIKIDKQSVEFSFTIYFENNQYGSRYGYFDVNDAKKGAKAIIDEHYEFLETNAPDDYLAEGGTIKTPIKQTNMKEQINTKDIEIKKYADGLPQQEDSIYNEHDAEVLSEYTGCSDYGYPDSFVDKIWKFLKEQVYSNYDSYTPINLFAANNLGAKLLKKAPKNSQIFNLNNDYICHLASRAILQQVKFDWLPRVEFGSIANYFCFPWPIEDGQEVVASNKYHITFISHEADNKYYKAVDCDKAITRLNYFQYCMARASHFSCAGDIICVSLHSDYEKDFTDFTVEKYNMENLKVINDLHYRCFMLKKL